MPDGKEGIEKGGDLEVEGYGISLENLTNLNEVSWEGAGGGKGPWRWVLANWRLQETREWGGGIDFVEFPGAW